MKWTREGKVQKEIECLEKGDPRVGKECERDWRKERRRGDQAG